MITGLVALSGLLLAELADGQTGYVPGLLRASGLVLLALHYLYAPVRWAVVRRGPRSTALAGGIAFMGVGVCLGLAALFVYGGGEAPPTMIAALLLALFAPPIGAWFGSGLTGRDDAAP